MGYAAADFGTMVNDSVRRYAYLEAIRRHTTPESRVLDLGCGFGFFTMAALALGARQVVGVEMLDAVRMLPDVIEANGYADRAEVYQDDVRKLDIGRFDLIISDLRGASPLYGEHLDVIAHANEHLLAPGGRLLPRSDRLFAALVHAPDWYEDRRQSLHVDEHDWSAVEAVVMGEPTRVSALGEDALASSPMLWAEVDYRSITSPSARHWSGSGQVDIAAAGRAHGIVTWFEAEIDDGIHFSTIPAEHRPTYGRMVYPFAEPLELVAGTTADLSIAAHRVKQQWVWEWQAETASGSRGGSTLGGLEIGLSALRALRDDVVPSRLL